MNSIQWERKQVQDGEGIFYAFNYERARQP